MIKHMTHRRTAAAAAAACTRDADRRVKMLASLAPSTHAVLVCADAPLPRRCATPRSVPRMLLVGNSEHWDAVAATLEAI